MDTLVFVMNERKMEKSMKSPLTFDRDRKPREKEKNEADGERINRSIVRVGESATIQMATSKKS